MIWVISFSGILVFAGLNTLLKCHVVPRVLRGKEAHLSEKEGISRVPGYEESIVSQRLFLNLHIYHLECSYITCFCPAVFTREVAVFADSVWSKCNRAACRLGDEKRCHGCTVPRIPSSCMQQYGYRVCYQFPCRSPLIVPAAFFFMAYFTVDLYSMYQVYRLKNVEHLRRSLGQNLRGCICNKAIFVIHHVLIIVFGPVFAVSESVQ